MKRFIFFSFFSALCTVSAAQLKTTPKCPDFDINILKGTVNDYIRPNSTSAQVKEKFPCFSSAATETDSAKCSEGVFYADKDVYFYSSRDYIELGPHFKGKLSLPLMGAARSSLFAWLGDPQVKDVQWDAFRTSYGILILYYDASSKVNKIQFSTQTAQTIRLCGQ